MTTGSIIIRRGPTADRLAFCPLEGEMVYDTQLKKLYVGDSITFGGNNVVSDVIVDPNGIPIILPISILEHNTISGVQLGQDLKTLTLGSGLTGTSYNGSTAVTVTVDSDVFNTPNKIVLRDSSGNFSASTITASLNGNAATATKLQSPVTINNVSFDGSNNIIVAASAGSLTGTTLNTTVTSSSLTTVGTLTNLTVTNTINGSITGNANTVTNGVYVTGSYSNPSWITSLSETKVLPTQSGNSGKYLSTNGTYTGWVDASSIGFPGVVGNAGKFLSNNGSSVFWDTVTTMATGIVVTPTGNIASTNVQTALAELDSEKASKNNPTFTGTVQGITSAMVGLGYVENTALSTWPGTSNITTVGIISSGSWNGSNIGLAVGGTNASLTANSGGIVYSTASALAITDVGVLGQVLTSNGSGIPTWSDQSNVVSGSVGSSVTFNNSGSGDVSGTVFNGSAAKTISYNTIGASPLAGSSSITTVGTLVSLTVSGTVAANGSGGITTTQTTFPLVNTTATTVNFAGAATAINIGANTGTTTVNHSLEIGGDLNVQGGITAGGPNVLIGATNLSVSDNMIYLNNGIEATITNAVGDGVHVTYTANNNYVNGMLVTVTGMSPTSFNVTNVAITSADDTSFTIASTNVNSFVSGGTARAKTSLNPDLGFAGGYNDGTYQHTGLFRDATDDTWKFFRGYTPEPDDNVYIDTAHASFALAPLAIAALTATTGTFSSTIAANGSSGITTTQTTFPLVNATATTVNFAGAATTLSIGAATGTTTVNNDLNLASGKVLKINSTSILSSTTLGSTVTGSSLTSVGTLTSLAVSGQTTSTKGYREGVVAIGSVSGVTSLDLSLGNIFTITLNASGIAFTFTNPPASGTACYITLIITQGTGGSKTFGSIANARWTDSVAPVLTTTAGKVDMLSLVTVDGGSNYFGSFSGANFG